MTEVEVQAVPVTWLGLPALAVGSPFGETDGWVCLVVEDDQYLIRVSEEEIT